MKTSTKQGIQFIPTFISTISMVLSSFWNFLLIEGPKAAEILQSGVDIDLSNLKFMNGITSSIFSIPNCRITRCGYTGEDGFEVGNFIG